MHGDEHLGNFYLEKDGRAGFLDWQVRKEPWCVSFAYFTVLALDILDRRAWEKDLLKTYLTALRGHGIAPPNFADAADGALEVLEFLRVPPPSAPAFERQTLTAVQSWEQEQSMRDVVLRSETARFLVADGWDYLRTYSVRTLGAWQAYVAARNRHPGAMAVNRLVESRKTMIVREIAELRVR